MGSPLQLVTRYTTFVTTNIRKSTVKSSRIMLSILRKDILLSALYLEQSWWLLDTGTYQLNTEIGEICQNLQRKKRGTLVLMEPPIGCTLLVSWLWLPIP